MLLLALVKSPVNVPNTPDGSLSAVSNTASPTAGTVLNTRTKIVGLITRRSQVRVLPPLFAKSLQASHLRLAFFVPRDGKMG